MINCRDGEQISGSQGLEARGQGGTELWGDGTVQYFDGNSSSLTLQCDSVELASMSVAWF